jgi:hypothetical protein
MVRRSIFSARIVLFSVLLPLCSFADEGETVHHELYLVRPGPTVTAPPGMSIQTPGSEKRRVPPRGRRDAVFKAAGLGSETESLDELDRDLLYMRANEWPIDRLRKRYPNYPAEKLETLKAEIAR